MRNGLISELNRALETDHDLIEQKLIKTTHELEMGNTGRFSGNVSALSIMCELLGVDTIHPVYEDDIIQRFD